MRENMYNVIDLALEVKESKFEHKFYNLATGLY